MSYIKNFKLSGYKSIKNVSGEFKPGLNILIGNNGSGKSNLLKFINKILGRDYTGLDVFNAEINYVKDGNLLDWKSVGKIGNPEKIASQGIEITHPDKDQEIEIELVEFNIPSEIPIISTEFNPRFSSSDRRLLLNDYTSLNWSFPLFLFVAGFNVQELSKIENIEKVEGDFVNQLLSEYFFKSFIEVKELSIYTPIQDIRFSNSIRISKIDPTLFEIRNIVFEYKIGNDWLSWEALSDGTRRMLYLYFKSARVSIVFAGDVMWDFKPIILIEEPEIGIHPHQLHSLMTFLKEKSKEQQVIISTHSPQVLDVLGANELDRIKIAEIDYEKGTIIRGLTDGEISKAQQYLKSEGMLSDYWRFSDFQRSKQSK